MADRNGTHLHGSIVLAEDPEDTTKLTPVRGRHLVLPWSVRAPGLLAVGAAVRDRILRPVLEDDIASRRPTVLFAMSDEAVAHAIGAWRRLRPGEPADGTGAGALAYLDFELPAHSVRLNMARSLADRDDCAVMAHSITYALPKGDLETPYWRNMAKQVLVEVFDCARRLDGPEQTLPAVYGLFADGVDALEAFARRRSNRPLLARISFLRDTHNGQTVLSEITNVLEVFQGKRVAEVCGHDGYVLSQVLSAGLLIARFREADIDRLSPLLSLLLDRLSRVASDRPHGDRTAELSVLFEGADLVAGLPQGARVLRSLVSAGWVATAAARTVETCAPLVSCFGSSAWLPPVPEADAALAGHLTGDALFEEADLRGGYEVARSRPVARKLVTADELRSLPWHPEFAAPPALFTLQGRPPFFAFLKACDAPPPLDFRLLKATAAPRKRRPSSASRQADVVSEDEDPFADDEADDGARLDALRRELGLHSLGPSAAQFFAEFESANKARLHLVRRVYQRMAALGVTADGLVEYRREAEEASIPRVLAYAAYARIRDGAAAGKGPAGDPWALFAVHAAASSPRHETEEWTTREVEAHLERVLAATGLREASSSAVRWWREAGSENISRRRLTVRLAEELLARHYTLSQWHACARDAKTDDVLAILYRMDYLHGPRKLS